VVTAGGDAALLLEPRCAGVFVVTPGIVGPVVPNVPPVAGGVAPTVRSGITDGAPPAPGATVIGALVAGAVLGEVVVVWAKAGAASTTAASAMLMPC
jgi:hypothetical protein